MSINRLSTRGLGPRTLKTDSSKPWKRSPCWTALPSVSGLEKFAGLVAVYPDSNFLALSAVGNYTVDWGDGSSTENISSGVQANHQFDYTTYDTSKSTMGPVTFTDTGDLVGRTAHGYANGDVVQFWNIVSTTGLVEAAIYYVINSITDSFQVSATEGGTAETLTTDGTGTLLQYKQSVVTVVPNAGTLTNVNLQQRHTQTYLQQYNAPWLDIAMEGANLTSVVIAAATLGVSISSLEQFSISGANGITDFSYMFYKCWALQSVPSLAAGAGTNFSYMFNYCTELEVVPQFDTGAGTNFAYMFSNCYRIKTIPLLDTHSGTNFSYAFYYCTALETVPLLNTGAGSNFASMFYGCSALKTIPLFNTSAGTNLSYLVAYCLAIQSIPALDTGASATLSGMMYGCAAIERFPLLNTSVCTNFSYMFRDCASLRELPVLDTSAGTNFSYMFYGACAVRVAPPFNTGAGTNFSYMFAYCNSLEAISFLDTSHGTNFANMFYACYALKTIPLLNTGAGTNLSNMFANCGALQSLPLLNTASGTGLSGIVSNCNSLERAAFSGTKSIVSYAQCKLSGPALDEIYTNLASGVSSKTITVTGNWGTPSDTPSIATAKGWTVTG